MQAHRAPACRSGRRRCTTELRLRISAKWTPLSCCIWSESWSYTRPRLAADISSRNPAESWKPWLPRKGLLGNGNHPSRIA